MGKAFFGEGELVAQDEGGGPPYTFKGHLTEEAAFAALEDHRCEEVDRAEWEVEHRWVRTVPCAHWHDDFTFMLYPAAPRTHGAFRATEMDRRPTRREKQA